MPPTPGRECARRADVEIFACLPYALPDMSREIRTIRGAIYVVTPTVEGSISLPDGTVIASFTTGRQTPFIAPAKAVIVSDDKAAVDIYLNSSSPIALGSNAAELKKHTEDASAHLTPAERRCLAACVPHFAEADAFDASDVSAAEQADAVACADTLLTDTKNTMNTNNDTTSWLAGLLTGWGIKESWAKIIAGALAGALAAAGFLAGS